MRSIATSTFSFATRLEAIASGNKGIATSSKDATTRSKDAIRLEAIASTSQERQVLGAEERKSAHRSTLCDAPCS